MAQNHVRVTAKKIARSSKSEESSSPDGWIISDFTIGYSTTEIEIGKPFTVMFGYTNLTPEKIDLFFETKQRILVRIYDSKGNLIYKPDEDTTPAPGTEEVESMGGTFWQEEIPWDKRYSENGVCLIEGYLRSINLPAVGSVHLVIPKSRK